MGDLILYLYCDKFLLSGIHSFRIKKRNSFHADMPIFLVFKVFGRLIFLEEKAN